METSELRLAVLDFISHVLHRPQLYGPLAEEMERTLDVLLWVLGKIDNKSQEYVDKLPQVGGEDHHRKGSFSRIAKNVDVKGFDDIEVFKYVSDQWRQALCQMGLELPAVD